MYDFGDAVQRKEAPCFLRLQASGAALGSKPPKDTEISTVPEHPAGIMRLLWNTTTVPYLTNGLRISFRVFTAFVPSRNSVTFNCCGLDAEYQRPIDGDVLAHKFDVGWQQVGKRRVTRGFVEVSCFE